MSKHKRQDSGTQPPCPWTALQKPPFPGTTQPGGGGGSRSRGGVKGDTCGPLLGSPVGSDAAEVLTPSVLEGTLKYRGVKVRVKSSHTGISWKPASGALPWCLELSVLTAKIPYDEVLGAWATSTQVTCSCVCRKEHAVVVAALLRPRRQPNAWKVEEHRLVAGSLEQAKEWVAAIQSALQLCYDRPRNLLVFINPFSGSKRSRQVWAYDAAPVFVKAGIKFTVIETLAPDHACSTLASMKADELAMYQGVVAVGGDGVFQECVMGVVAQRARGGKNAAVAARLRLGHIPGGSTDAVAYTLHGTRSAEAAALHIALGDRLPLDVARVDCIDPDHLPPPLPVPVAQQPASIWAPDAVLLPTGGGDGPLTPAGGVGARLLPSVPSGGSADGQNNNSSTRGARGGEAVSRSGTRGGEQQLTTTDPRVALVCPLTHSHSSSFSTAAPISGGSPTAARLGPRAASTGFGVADTLDLRLGGNGDGGGSAETRPVATGPAPLMTKHFVCQAAYGFLGDVMHFSEGLRCLGPSRYDVSGVVQFLRLRSYPLLISYRPAPIVRNSTTNGMAPEPASTPCMYPCEVCRMAGINLARVSADDDPWPVPPQSYASPGPHSHSHQLQAPPGSPPDTSAPVSSSSLTGTKAHQPAPTSSSSLPATFNQRPSSQPPTASQLPPAASGAANTSTEQLLAPGGASGEQQGHGAMPAAGAAAADGGGWDGGWVTVQGEYISVMCVVTPCRSDKSTQGILPHAHLSDGRMYLVMVSKCGRLDYLRFLLRLSSRGLEDGCFPFVKIVPITALSMRPSGGALGKESCWNVDGELLPTNNVRVRIQRGMVDVFARGVE